MYTFRYILALLDIKKWENSKVRKAEGRADSIPGWVLYLWSSGKPTFIIFFIKNKVFIIWCCRLFQSFTQKHSGLLSEPLRSSEGLTRVSLSRNWSWVMDWQPCWRFGFNSHLSRTLSQSIHGLSKGQNIFKKSINLNITVCRPSLPLRWYFNKSQYLTLYDYNQLLN